MISLVMLAFACAAQPPDLWPGDGSDESGKNLAGLLEEKARPVSKPVPDVFVESIRVDKLVYRYDSPVAISCDVKARKNAKGARIKIELFHGLEPPVILLEDEFDLAADESRKLTCVYGTGSGESGAEYGYEVRADIVDASNRVATAREYFMVTDSPLKIGHLTIPLACMSVHSPESGAARMRAMYFCMAESPFWAPCDWSGMATDLEYWFSGQAARIMSRAGLKSMVREVHDLGGWMLFYATKWASGPAGFEIARKHPEWFHWDYDWYGCRFDIPELEWKARSPIEDGKWLPMATAPGGLPAILALVQKPEVARYGFEQIAGSVRIFGWDGIRLDSYGWYVEQDLIDLEGERVLSKGADTAAMEADLVKGMVAAGRQAVPHFVYGANVGWPTDAVQAKKPKFAAEAASGGLIMDEGMAGRTSTAEGSRPDSWKNIREYLKLAIPVVREAGGYPYGIVGSIGADPMNPDGAILHAVLLASGMHLCYGVAEDYYPYMRLYARHCDLLYGDGMKFVDEPESLVSVTSAATVWWREYVRRRDLPDGRVQFIVHLINPSVNEYYRYHPDLETEPKTQTDIHLELTLPENVRVEKVFRVTSDRLNGPDVLSLPFDAESGVVGVNAPELIYWNIIVFEGAVE